MDHSFNCMQQACSGPLSTINYFQSKARRRREKRIAKTLTVAMAFLHLSPDKWYQCSLFNEGNVAFRKWICIWSNFSAHRKASTLNEMEFLNTLANPQQTNNASLPRDETDLNYRKQPRQTEVTQNCMQNELIIPVTVIAARPSCQWSQQTCYIRQRYYRPRAW